MIRALGTALARWIMPKEFISFDPNEVESYTIQFGRPRVAKYRADDASTWNADDWIRNT